MQCSSQICNGDYGWSVTFLSKSAMETLAFGHEAVQYYHRQWRFEETASNLYTAFMPTLQSSIPWAVLCYTRFSVLVSSSGYDLPI